jgi:hypothetical protein
MALIHDKEEPLMVEDPLKIVIQRMGVSEFSKFVEAAPQNTDKFFKGKRKPKRETLDRFLKPFGLKTGSGFKCMPFFDIFHDFIFAFGSPETAPGGDSNDRKGQRGLVAGGS